MNIKLLFIPLLLFSSQLYAETIHLGILNTSGNEAENVLYAETASVLKNKLKPRNVEVSTYDLPGLEKPKRRIKVTSDFYGLTFS